MQRVAQYDVYDKIVADADKALAEALVRLDEMERIPPFANAHPGTSESSLAMKGQALRPAIVAARAALAESPAPAPTPK